MDTAKLKSFAQNARRNLMSQTSDKIQRVLDINSLARRSNLQAVQALEAQIEKVGLDKVVDQVAYFWFNRLSALRFMDANGYTKSAVVSIAEGSAVPQILADAESGFIDLDIVDEKVSQKIFDLLQGRQTSLQPQEEAYGLLLVAACNYWYKTMPFLFQSAGDYTELLMPDNLLAQNSILSDLSKIIADDDCQDVEVIGWLYQYYISEKKDQVFEEMKKNKKITPEKIPAATQLFTPHWIVKYLVENSLGRLWMLNHPESSLKDSMEYYIAPQEGEKCDFIKISSPEELKVCDPACGSGHMLTYAFDLLYLIYEEQGYAPSEISKLILENNLFGIEIDERAGELAAFALNMKARSKDRRFFRREVKPHICVLRNINFSDDELDSYIDTLGRDLFTINLQTALRQFEEADNFGSLIRPVITDVGAVRALLKAKNMESEMFLTDTHKKVLEVLKAIDYLSPRYHVVIANPPYMGGKGMNPRLAAWLKTEYPDGKLDLFAAFMDRGYQFIKKFGYSSMVTMQSWMFLSSFEELRKKLINLGSIVSMSHMANMVMGIAFGTSATVFQKSASKDLIGKYCFVEYQDIENGKPKEFPPQNDRNKTSDGDFFSVNARDFEKIPGSPIAYWIPHEITSLFDKAKFPQYCETRCGMATGQNEVYLRHWNEVSFNKIGFGLNRIEAQISGKKWFPYNKAGEFRKWSGNKLFVVNWENDGQELQNTLHPDGHRIWAHNFNLDVIFKPHLGWSDITSGELSFRYFEQGYLFDGSANAAFLPKEDSLKVLAFANSPITSYVKDLLNPTMHFKPGNFLNLPYRDVNLDTNLVKENISISLDDWSTSEMFWLYKRNQLVTAHSNTNGSLRCACELLISQHKQTVGKLMTNEQAINDSLIRQFGLDGILSSMPKLNEIALLCNPHYKYSNNDGSINKAQLSDLIKDLVSYSVGCMFGRYSIDKEGLILANQGDDIEQYNEQVQNSRFEVDKDNCIPILESSWFEDDIVERFREFLRVTFGEEHFAENLEFIEKALNVDGKAKYSIRDYFVKDFYKHHVSMYKKRPIYWLFESPKGAFRALIYMHRYRPETVSVVLNEYLRKLCQKYEMAKIHQDLIASNESSSAKEKAAALKESAKLAKQIKELKDYENEVLYPLAQQQIAIDLDDGVKVNYCKFGKALKKIAGLESKDE